MTKFNSSEILESLAAEIGQNIYIDLAKWHLYLADAKLHTTLAEGVLPLIQEQRLNEESVKAVLQEIKVKIGGGKREIPLLDLLPSSGERELINLLSDFSHKL